MKAWRNDDPQPVALAIIPDPIQAPPATAQTTSPAHDGPMTFNFEDHQVRTLDRDGEVWFVATDVCDALGIKNSRDAVAKLDHDEKGVGITDTLGGPQEVTVISEPGMFRLTLTSRKDEARRFSRWVTHEVLPAIRRTGRYCEPAHNPSTAVVVTQRYSVPLAGPVASQRISDRPPTGSVGRRPTT